MFQRDAPSVTVSPEYNVYNVIENTTNFELNCTVTGANPAVKSYRWYKDGLIISTAATYTLSTVQRSNTGNYTCDATNSVDSSDPSSALQLNVLFGIELNPIRRKEYQEGKQLSITCTGKSKPAITDYDIEWTKENNNTFIRTGKQLVINNVNKLDLGTYVCSVVIQLTPTVGQPVNVTGTTSVEVDILYCRFHFTDIPIVSTSSRLNPYNVIENTTHVNVTCRVTDSNPPATSFRWYKDNSVIGTTATYTIERMNRSHSGRYSCDATNRVGTSRQSSELTLNVLCK
ncbi:unnamed protein product [Mytilus coruscus]|uniref:Ig-like domain-containing protein n=1 Tax=Mytilus coruscus TaxID=42192 RepID=A0A6J8AEI7_MYTCO|nr:unnamed protein product [Mytilus coruscus]